MSFLSDNCCVFLWMQDSEGRAPIHIAISNQHSIIIQLLISHPEIRLNIRDRQGMTPFACAMTHKNNKAAEAILKRESGAAEQVCVHIQTTLRMLLSKSWRSVRVLHLFVR